MGVRTTNNSLQPSDNVSHDGHLVNWFNSALQSQTGGTNAPPGAAAEVTASGGIVNIFTDPGPGNVYKAHIFTSSGTFELDTAIHSGF